MTAYLVTWAIDIDEASSPDDAARQAYDHFMRPGSIAHVFTVRNKTTDREFEFEFEVDLDRGADTNRDGEPLSYPASSREKD